MLTITGTTINQEYRQIHVYHYEEVTLPSGRVLRDESSTVFDEDVEFDNKANWGNDYIEEMVAKKKGIARSLVTTSIRKVPIPPTE